MKKISSFKIFTIVAVLLFTYLTPVLSDQGKHSYKSSFDFVSDYEMSLDSKNIKVKKVEKMNFSNNTLVDIKKMGENSLNENKEKGEKLSKKDKKNESKLRELGKKHLAKNKDKIKKNIRDNNFFAIFHEDGIQKVIIDKDIDYPISIDIEEALEKDPYSKIVARVYYKDKKGRMNISDIGVPTEYTKKEAYKDVCETITEVVVKNKMKKKQLKDYIYGTAHADFYSQSALYQYTKIVKPYGKIQFNTEFNCSPRHFRVEDKWKDLWSVKNNFLFQPGDSVWDNGWSVTELATRIRVDEPTNAVVYNTFPDNEPQATTYGASGSIGLAIGWSDVGVDFGISGTTEKEKSNIEYLKSKRLGETENYWEMSIEEESEFAKNDIKFKPLFLYTTPSEVQKSVVYVGANMVLDHTWHWHKSRGHYFKAELWDNMGHKWLW